MHLGKAVRRLQAGAAAKAQLEAVSRPPPPTISAGEIRTQRFEAQTLAIGGVPQGGPPPPYPYPPYPYPPSGQFPQAPQPQGIPYPAQGPRFEESEHERIIRVVQEGVSIPAFKAAPVRVLLPEDKSALRDTNLAYPLIPRFPKEGEAILAYAHIHWNGEEVVYDVVEPPISEEEQKTIDRVKLELEERLDVDFTKLGEIKAKDFLRQQIQKSFSAISGLDDYRKAVLTYYIERDVAGLGRIEPLMNDPNIEDISCDGVFIPLFVYHRDPKLGSLRTNVLFEDTEELNVFVLRIAQKANKSISVASPLLDAALPDGSRIQATLGTDVARKGSNFTIRRFTEKPLTPTHMLGYKTLDSTQLAYLWMAIEHGQSILVSGSTASGKTTLLNALSLFIRPALKVVSIEDTPELRLPLPHWVPHVARSAIAVKGKTGEVTLFDLLKSSLRQRPDYIIVGEVRGREAFVLFQQMATGHASLSTIHAASISQLIDRLISPPISLPPGLLENLNIIVFLTHAKLHNDYVRRADTIVEIVGIAGDRPVGNTVFAWDPVADRFEPRERSVVLRNIAKRTGLSEAQLQEDLLRRRQVLEWMLANSIDDYREVARIINLYYTNLPRLMNFIAQGGTAAGFRGQPEAAADMGS